MRLNDVPEALRIRLGEPATAGLVDFVSMSHGQERAAMIDAVASRFERRVAEETSALRVEMARQGAALREEMVRQGAELREDMVKQGADLREEMARQGAELREEMGRQGGELRRDMMTLWSGLRDDVQQLASALRSEMAVERSETLKWCFLFWVGQVVVVGTLMGVMLRLVR
jgi:hypothetical protein